MLGVRHLREKNYPKNGEVDNAVGEWSGPPSADPDLGLANAGTDRNQRFFPHEIARDSHPLMGIASK